MNCFSTGSGSSLTTFFVMQILQIFHVISQLIQEQNMKFKQFRNIFLV